MVAYSVDTEMTAAYTTVGYSDAIIYWRTEMLIDTNIDIQKLKNPEAMYWPAYFYCWNDVLSEDSIVQQIQDMAAMGAKSVCPLPEPKEFRPETMQTWLEPDYLSPGYMAMYKKMAEEVSKLGMRMWLYDEGGWPSGGACGKVVQQHPELASQRLQCETAVVEAGSTINIPDDCLSAYLCKDGKPVRKLAPGSSECIGDTECSIVVYSVYKFTERNPHTPAYPDLLNPLATAEFLRITHEAYKFSVGEYFGNVIHFVFTDEPSIKNPPWTDGLDTDFHQKFGYDIKDHLAAIFDPNGIEDALARIDFYDWWSQRFVDAYFNVCKAWCKENNLLLAGHVGGEDTTEGSRNHGFGHATRVLRSMDVPGVDAIWRQVFPGKKNHHFPKFASSAAHQNGTPWSFAELFAVYGSGITPEQMKWVTDYHFVRGINLIVASAYAQSTREHFMAGERPNYGPSNPMWKRLGDYHGYVARLGYLLSLGKPDIGTALYFPVRDIWAGGPDFEAVTQSNDNAAAALLDCQCDFDMVDDDVLGNAEVSDGFIQVGAASYHTICVSKTKWMPDSIKNKLSEFCAAGGNVLWLSEYEHDYGESICLDEIPDFVQPTLRISPQYCGIRICRRQLENGSLIFITNESLKGLCFTVHLGDDKRIACIDPVTGNLFTPAGMVHTDTGWDVPIGLPFAGSCLIGVGEDFDDTPFEALETSNMITSIPTEWKIRRLVTHIIDEHDITINKVEEETQPVELGDWENVYGQSFSGECEYSTYFECDIETGECVIDLGEVRYACEVFLNGESLGTRLWHPYSFRATGKLREGINELRIVVSNTMANQYVTSRIFDDWSAAKTGPYHSIAMEFEKDTAFGGLYGPVQIKLG